MPSFDITEKRHRISIFKLSRAHCFKYFFDDPGYSGNLSLFMISMDAGSKWQWRDNGMMSCDMGCSLLGRDAFAAFNSPSGMQFTGFL
jgi:hypothetical protein